MEVRKIEVVVDNDRVDNQMAFEEVRMMSSEVVGIEGELHYVEVVVPY